MKVGLYARVSTQDQQTLVLQREVMEAYVQQRAWEVAVQVEEIGSGASERGQRAAQARGVKMGRKPLLTAQQVAHARKLLGQGERPNDVAQSLKVSRRTLYRALQ